MQVLAGAGLQGDMMTHIVMCRAQTTRQEYQLARPFLHDGTVMRNKGSAQFGQLILTDQIP